MTEAVQAIGLHKTYGRGASAVVALDRSIDLASTDHPTGQVRLLSQLIDQVVPPTAWPSIRADVLAAATPRVREATLAIEHDDHEVWETIAPPKARRPEPPSPAPPAPGIEEVRITVNGSVQM